MPATKTYVVVALAAQVNTVNGYGSLMHRGAVLPENVDPEQLKHLLHMGIVEEGDPVGGLEPVLDANGNVPDGALPVPNQPAQSTAAKAKAEQDAKAKADADAKAKADADAAAKAKAAG